MRAAPATSTRAFTIIEMMAVVFIIGLLMVSIVPRLGTTASELRAEGLALASHIEMARQRAIMTGKPHRVLIDVEEGGYRVEWFVSEAEARGEGEFEEEADELDPRNVLGTGGYLDLSPPSTRDRSYHAIPLRQFGSTRWLPDDIYFDGIDTADGWLESGDVEIVFDRDGTTGSAEVVISDARDRTVLLDVRPLLDVVRVRDER